MLRSKIRKGAVLAPLALCVLATFGAPRMAAAAELEAVSRIIGVTVFPDAAEVSRMAEVNVPAGASSIVFKGLPQGLDPNSLRIEAAAPGNVTIGSVASRVEPAKRPAAPSSIAEKLRSLENERRLLQENLRALDAKKKMIERYAQASPEKLGEQSGPMKVEDWSKAWSAVGEGLAKAAEEIQAAQLRMREVTQEIAALRQSNRGSPSGLQPQRTVTVDISADVGVSTRLVLIYRVAGARWQPVYDARLSSGGKDGKPLLQLVRRASVSQRTGEDWNNVALTVSTVRARRGTQAPDVQTQVLRIFEPPPPTPAAQAPRVERRSAGKAANADSIVGQMNLYSSARPAREQEASVDAGPYSARFRIAGAVALNGDGSARVFRIATAEIEPEIVVRAAPALDTTAYLEAGFVNKDEAPLLPGIVNLHRDGVFVGRGRFELIAPGQTATLGFGADDSIRIKRVPVVKTQSGPGWIGNSRSLTSDFETIVKNLHGFAVKVRIIDRLPVAEDSEITVKPLPTNTTPSTENVDGKRGVLRWSFDLGPGAEKKIRLGWQVQWPDGKRIAPQPGR